MTLHPKIRFKGFGNSWINTKASEILSEVSSGWSPQCEAFNVQNEEWGVLTTSSVTWDGFNELANKKLPLSLEPREALRVTRGDILITRAGPTNRVGVISIVNEIPSFNLMLSDKIIRLRTNEKISSRFLAMYLGQPKVQNYLSSRKSGLAEAQSNISQAIIKSIPINMPCVDEQQKIADFLSSVEKKISLLKEKHILLTQYKKGVMQKLFKQEIRFKDDNGNDFPEWQTIPLSKLASKNSVKNKDESVNTVLTNSAKDGIVNQGDYFKKDIANQQNLGGYTVVEKNDFVYNPRISELAPVGPIKRNHIGQGVMSPLYTVFRFKDDSLLDYLELYFNTTMWHRYMHSIANFGARHDRMNITTSDFYELPLPVPSEDERAKIVSFVNALQAKVNAVKQQIELTQTFKKGLLQQMFV
tara:strand:- start:37725 stop:38969 length:1245 start_codon:yes stop_codon:yes gene_type:complete